MKRGGKIEGRVCETGKVREEEGEVSVNYICEPGGRREACRFLHKST